MKNFHSISVTEVYDLYAEGGGIHLIDVRTPGEFAEVHASPATNMPLDSLRADDLAARKDIDKNEPIYLICRSGGRSAQACQIFAEAGFENIYNVVGGTMDWVAKGLPTGNDA